MTTGSGQDAATITRFVECTRMVDNPDLPTETPCTFVGDLDLDYRDGAATWECPKCRRINTAQLEGTP